mgnify:CR=1 FL=1
MSKIWFTSDLHLGHKLASKMRGFDSVKEHDEDIIVKLIEQTRPRDILFVLGDVAMSKESLQLLKAVPCRKKMLFGNHDEYGHEEYLKVFESLHGFYKYKGVWLSHCPIHPQEMYRCKANIHGHIHKGAATPELPFPYINMNWDFWGRAVDFQEDIKPIIKENYNEG